MPRSASARPDEDDEAVDDGEEDDEDDEEGEAPPPRRRARTPPRRRSRPQHPPPVRRWRASEEDEEEEEEEVAPVGRTLRRPKRKPVYWRARDSLFFEPLVALAIIVVLLVSLFAYTQNWPPIYVVESGSMQHGSADQIGLINTGDLVLAQKVAFSSVVPYVTGLRTGYSTYGESGDVLLYWANGQGPTPIIHRAILYLEWVPNGSNGFYQAPDLSGLPCGQANAVYAVVLSGGTQSCNPMQLSMSSTLELFDIGWQSLNLTIPLGSLEADGNSHSGFLTMGDNNQRSDQWPNPALSPLVEPSWIIGVARGMIPWFGAVKLLLEGQASMVPAQSWEFMGLTIVGAILVAFGIHYALRTEGIETPIRREEEQEERAEAEAAASSEPAPHGWLSSLRRRHAEDEEEEETAEEARHRSRTRPPPSTASSHAPSHRGRPAPRVRRTEKPAKKRVPDDEL